MDGESVNINSVQWVGINGKSGDMSLRQLVGEAQEVKELMLSPMRIVSGQ